MNFANIDISPPNSNVVTRTITRVELTNRLEFGDNLGLTYKLSAKAIAPIING
jgi:hypothetical protein